MNTIIQPKIPLKAHTTIKTGLSAFLLIFTMLILSACSTIDAYRSPSQAPAVSLPKIPEIKRQQTAKPRITSPRKIVVPAPKAQVRSSSYQIRNVPVVVKPKKAPLTQQQIAEQQRLKQEAKQQMTLQAQKNATVDIDPFAAIPDSSSIRSTVTTTKAPSTSTSTNRLSPAVKTLMVSARADIALGRSRSAISKLERGLRIEPQNGQIWHMLAKAHYSNSAYLHSISIAKKSNANTNDTDLINQNWQLIKQAGERSGNASAIKEALDYMKLNP